MAYAACECRTAQGLSTADTRACVHAVGSWSKWSCQPTTGAACLPGWSTCVWHGQERIAWLHFAKAGSSFGTALLHLANASVPDNLTIPHVFDQDLFEWLSLQHFRRATFWIPPLGFG